MEIEYMKAFILLAKCSKPYLSHGHLATFNYSGQYCTDVDAECNIGSLAVFACDPDYLIFGYGYSRCRGRGQWDPPISQSRCKGKNPEDIFE